MIFPAYLKPVIFFAPKVVNGQRCCDCIRMERNMSASSGLIMQDPIIGVVGKILVMASSCATIAEKHNPLCLKSTIPTKPITHEIINTALPH